MALKKGVLDSYIKERELPTNTSQPSLHCRSPYSHNRVFDEPDSLKKLIEQDKNSVSDKKESNKDLSSEINASIGFNRSQTVSNGFKSLGKGKEPLQKSSSSTSSEDKSMFHVEHSKKSKEKLNVDQNSNGLNRFQTVSNETVSIGLNGSQTVSNETVSIGLNRVQTVSETVSKRPSLSELKILYFFQENCNEKGIATTQRTQIARSLNLKLAGVKTALNRLKSKGYIVLQDCSKGRYTGYTSYSLTSSAHQILALPETLNLLGFKRFQTVSETVSNFPNSSSNKMYITTMPIEWREVNYLSLSHIGFSDTQLKQLYETNLVTAETVQDAINRFAYSLEHNDKVKVYSDPLNVLMGVLRKGQRWNEPNYIPAKELALRQMLEEKRKQKEKYDAMLNELMELEFPTWRKKLTQEEIQKIVPPDILKVNLAPAITASLRTYFIDNVLVPKIENK